ncbi:MAG: metal-dependent transcriptional regulator [Propionibacteriaceae bacterium]
MDIDSITPVAQDYVKAIWSATEWGDPPITTKALANRFGTSPANVTDTVKRLAAQGLVDHQPYKPIRLTDTGRRLAVVMVRRHRLIETFLVTTLGYRWDEIHDEAERLEHGATDLLINRIDAFLGYPTTDPHGDPIPTDDGRTHTAEGAVRLSEAGPGRHLVHRISDANPDNLDTAATLGITPGSIIDTYLDDATLVLATPGGPQPVPALLATATWTTPVT